ncbi:hypothetical protein [Chryseobacterium oncorhynchi]|uniref:hypothetical protein n=1 Tax=Chryseobacterium oncorhynchi TaxID=741074 RepID=UPI001402AE99|nr:hypothetical protein [Chryseobacterium oncorhynchi]
MRSNEMFPPTVEELEKIIANLKAMLADEKHQDQWIRINSELIEKQKQLQEIIIKDNTL